METICLKCEILVSGINKKNTTGLSSAELAQRVVKVKAPITTADILVPRPCSLTFPLNRGRAGPIA